MLESLLQLNYVVIFVAAAASVAAMTGLWAMVTRPSRRVRAMTRVRSRGTMEAVMRSRALLYVQRWNLHDAAMHDLESSSGSPGPSRRLSDGGGL